VGEGTPDSEDVVAQHRFKRRRKRLSAKEMEGRGKNSTVQGENPNEKRTGHRENADLQKILSQPAAGSCAAGV